MTTKKQQQLEEKQEAIARLKEILEPGDTIYTVLRHKSSSGMYHAIDLYVFRAEIREVRIPTGKRRENGTTIDKRRRKWTAAPLYLTFNVALATGHKYDRRRGAIGVGGSGFDKGFHLVYDLSFALFGDGYTLHHRWLG